jgi:hypothetical protein
MTHWDRVNRLELELREAHATIRRLEAQVETARSVAVHATQVCALCQGEIVDVPIIGEAT